MSDLNANPIYEKILAEQGSFEKFLDKIPGYKGYKEMQARRDADQILRAYVVKLLKEQMTRFVSIEKKLISSGGIKFASPSKTAKLNFQTFIDKVATAMPGYSGFFGAIKIQTDELDRIYQFDAALVVYADKYKDAIDVFEKADKDAAGAAIAALEALAQEAIGVYNSRDQLLTGLAHSK